MILCAFGLGNQDKHYIILPALYSIEKLPIIATEGKHYTIIRKTNVHSLINH